MANKIQRSFCRLLKAETMMENGSSLDRIYRELQGALNRNVAIHGESYESGRATVVLEALDVANKLYLELIDVLHEELR